jgi:uncharacterized protein YecE (DUF72 family)
LVLSRLGWPVRFALKLPGELTHERRLRGGDEVLKTFCKRAERPALESFVMRLPQGLWFAAEFRHPDWLEGDVLSCRARPSSAPGPAGD